MTFHQAESNVVKTNYESRDICSYCLASISPIHLVTYSSLLFRPISISFLCNWHSGQHECEMLVKFSQAPPTELHQKTFKLLPLWLPTFFLSQKWSLLLGLFVVYHSFLFIRFRQFSIRYRVVCATRLVNRIARKINSVVTTQLTIGVELNMYENGKYQIFDANTLLLNCCHGKSRSKQLHQLAVLNGNGCALKGFRHSQSFVNIRLIPWMAHVTG